MLARLRDYHHWSSVSHARLSAPLLLSLTFALVSRLPLDSREGQSTLSTFSPTSPNWSCLSQITIVIDSRLICSLVLIFGLVCSLVCALTIVVDLWPRISYALRPPWSSIHPPPSHWPHQTDLASHRSIHWPLSTMETLAHDMKVCVPTDELLHQVAKASHSMFHSFRRLYPLTAHGELPSVLRNLHLVIQIVKSPYTRSLGSEAGRSYNRLPKTTLSHRNRPWMSVRSAFLWGLQSISGRLEFRRKLPKTLVKLCARRPSHGLTSPLLTRWQSVQALLKTFFPLFPRISQCTVWTPRLTTPMFRWHKPNFFGTRGPTRL